MQEGVQPLSGNMLYTDKGLTAAAWLLQRGERMHKGLTQDEIHLLLKDMAELCLRPPEGEAAWLLETQVRAPGREQRNALLALCGRLDRLGPAVLALLGLVVLAPLVAVTMQVALLGPWLSLAGLGLSFALGAGVILKQGRRAFRSLAETLVGLQAGRSVPLNSVHRAVAVGGGLLLLLPDPLTSLIGGALLVPGLRRMLASRLQNLTNPRLHLM